MAEQIRLITKYSGGLLVKPVPQRIQASGVQEGDFLKFTMNTRVLNFLFGWKAEVYVAQIAKGNQILQVEELKD